MNRHLHGNNKTGIRDWELGTGKRKAEESQKAQDKGFNSPIHPFTHSFIYHALCSMLLAALAAPVYAQTIKEFPIPTAYSRPVDLAVDSNGDIWLIEENANKLARFVVKKEAFEEIDIPYKNAGPSSIFIKPVPADMKQGNDIIWLALSLDNSIVSFTPSLNTSLSGQASKTFKRFQIPTPNSSPYGIAVAPSGVVWFTERNANKIGSLEPTTGRFKEFPLPTQNSQPSGITAVKDGTVWWTEADGNKLGMLDPKNGSITEYEILTKFANASRITVDNDGNIWFVEQSSNKLGMFNRTAKRINNAIIPTHASVPIGIAVDKNNIVWFTENRGNKLGRFDVKTASFTEYDIPTYRSLPTGIAISQDGTVWFTEVDRDANRLGMLKYSQETEVRGQELKAKNQETDDKSKKVKKDIFTTISGIILISAAVVILYLIRRGKGE